MIEATAELLGLIVALLYLAAVPICFLKGRYEIGWFGAVTFVAGAVVNFPLYRYLHEGDLDGWLWLWRALGLVIGVVVIAAAAQRAKAGSWWVRRSPPLTGETESRSAAIRDR